MFMLASHLTTRLIPKYKNIVKFKLFLKNLLINKSDILHKILNNTSDHTYMVKKLNKL